MPRHNRTIIVALTLLFSLWFLYLLQADFDSSQTLDDPDLLTRDAEGNLIPQIPIPINPQPSTDSGSPPILRRANATFVMLARNSDADDVVAALTQIENQFNVNPNRTPQGHGQDPDPELELELELEPYPYVFLNDEEFSEEFKTRVTQAINPISKIEFGRIPPEMWEQPEWIDEEKARQGRERMVLKGVKYGDSVSYRNMCRFNSGFFFKHPLMQKYRWYWRLEPGVKFPCQINEDPFVYMQQNNKTYGFTIATYEIPSTIKSLWDTVKEFMKSHPEHIAKDNSMNFISYNHGLTYNGCHFWSNFEIGDMDTLFRTQAYHDYFTHLDKKGGFYYERWGDAPIHSIFASLFLSKSQIHFFENIGYQHDDWVHCPLHGDVWVKGKCSCDMSKSFDYDPSSCKPKWDRA